MRWEASWLLDADKSRTSYIVKVKVKQSGSGSEKQNGSRIQSSLGEDSLRWEASWLLEAVVSTAGALVVVTV